MKTICGRGACAATTPLQANAARQPMMRESVLRARGMQLSWNAVTAICASTSSAVYNRAARRSRWRGAAAERVGAASAPQRSWRALHPQEDQAQDGYRIIASDHHRTTVVLRQALAKEQAEQCDERK